jgi:hypothetical protein
MKRRFMSVLLSLLLMVSAIAGAPTVVHAASKPSSWAVQTVSEAKELGLATAALTNDYSAATTRLEFCKATVNLLRRHGYDTTSVTPHAFADSNDPDIGIAAALGITSGTDKVKNLFSPDRQLNREEAATLLNNVLSVVGMRADTASVAWTDATGMSSWAVQPANDMYNHGIMSGMDTTKLVFSPKSSYTHEQSIITLLKVWKYINNGYTPFDRTELREATNNIELVEGVKTVMPESDENILISADETNMRYTFDNNGVTIEDFAVGDKFVIYPSESLPGGAAGVIEDIQYNGDQAVIKSGEVKFSDIVEVMDISDAVPITSSMITEFGDGVTLLGGTQNQVVNNGMNTRAIGISGIVQNQAAYAGTSTIAAIPVASDTSGGIRLKVDKEINSGMNVEGYLEFNPTFIADFDLRRGWLGIPTGVHSFEVAIDILHQPNN